jgi:hypothetical protein
LGDIYGVDSSERLVQTKAQTQGWNIIIFDNNMDVTGFATKPAGFQGVYDD